MEFINVLIQIEKLSAGHAAVRRYKEISLYQLSPIVQSLGIRTKEDNFSLLKRRQECTILAYTKRILSILSTRAILAYTKT